MNGKGDERHDPARERLASLVSFANTLAAAWDGVGKPVVRPIRKEHEAMLRIVENAVRNTLANEEHIDLPLAVAFEPHHLSPQSQRVIVCVRPRDDPESPLGKGGAEGGE